MTVPCRANSRVATDNDDAADSGGSSVLHLSHGCCFLAISALQRAGCSQLMRQGWFCRDGSNDATLGRLHRFHYTYNGAWEMPE